MLLASVQQVCHASITFRFRVPLNRSHRATDWNNIRRCGGPSNCSPCGAAGNSMSTVSENTILLGTIDDEKRVRAGGVDTIDIDVIRTQQWLGRVRLAHRQILTDRLRLP